MARGVTSTWIAWLELWLDGIDEDGVPAVLGWRYTPVLATRATLNELPAAGCHAAPAEASSKSCTWTAGASRSSGTSNTRTVLWPWPLNQPLTMMRLPLESNLAPRNVPSLAWSVATCSELRTESSLMRNRLTTYVSRS